MAKKPNKILYKNQKEVWKEAEKYLIDLVSGEKCVDEAIVWASLAEGKFGLYEYEHKGREGSDIDLVVLVNEKYPIPESWGFTNVKKDVFDLYKIGKFVHQDHVHEIDGLLVFPSRHDLQEVRDMLADRSKSIYLKHKKSILHKYKYSSMVKIIFLPDSDRPDLTEHINVALKEYENIWNKEGREIVKTVRKISKLDFKENEINAIVYKSFLPSRSFPLSLNANIQKESKPANLIHELCHRILSGNRIRIDFKKTEDASFEIHKVVDLILYDILVDLYGEKYADNNVKYESRSRNPAYKKAWKWTLSLNKKERAEKFKEATKKKLFDKHQ